MFRCFCLFLLLHAWALAELRLTPGSATVAAGSSCAFTATWNGQQPRGGWIWSVQAGPGSIDAGTGLYRAPQGHAATATVRAVLRSDPRVVGEASITVLPLPAELPGLVGAALGEPWVEPFASNLPFLDPETRARPALKQPILQSDPPLAPSIWLAGYGVPFHLDLGPTEAIDALRIAYREGDHWVRRDLHTPRTELAFHARVRSFSAEALKRSSLRPGVWRSTILPVQVDVRGVLPYCGNAVAPGGHADGAGQAARFLRPFGIVPVGENRGSAKAPLLVTDPASHVLRTVTPEGVVATLCGQPGLAGHRDSPTLLQRVRMLFGCADARPPLFHSPTHVAMLPDAFNPSWKAVVADSGNHVIRTVRSDGQVATLAGTPGQAGYLDSDSPGQAAFNDPQGLAVDEAGRVYVADRGNRAIRVIDPGGPVATLAGGPEAHFTDLKGICLYPPMGGLLVLDGHAVRLVELPGGGVVTLLGVVDRPGFRDIAAGEASGQPCLNNPTGIARTGSGLAIADHGNHAVRLTSPGFFRMWTVAGDPAQGATRFGRVRDGLPGPLRDGLATLEGPWTVASRFPAEGPPDFEVFVTTGCCLAEINHKTARRAPLAFRAEAPPPEATVKETCVVTFSVATLRPEVQYWADFLDPDGEWCAGAHGVAAGGETVALQGHFNEPGTGTVRIQGVTDQGMSAVAELRVVVRFRE